MVISNIGTIVLSLPSRSTVVDAGMHIADSAASKNVRILSLSNTISRILVGPFADYVSPVAAYLPTGTIVFARKHRVSRFIFLSIPAFVLGVSFLWMELAVHDREGAWILRLVLYFPWFLFLHSDIYLALERGSAMASFSPSCEYFLYLNM